MPPPDFAGLLALFEQGDYHITNHGFQAMGNDHVTVAILEASLGQDAPEIIEDYPDDDRGPCCLILWWTPIGEPLHAVIGYDGDRPDVVTVYSPPDPNIWESDFRTRRG